MWHGSGFRQDRIGSALRGENPTALRRHVWPRYDWEPAERVTKPVWLYPPESWSRPAPQDRLGPQHDPLRRALVAQLEALSRSATGPSDQS